MELVQKFGQKLIVMKRKQDVTHWFVRGAAELAAANVKETAQREMELLENTAKQSAKRFLSNFVFCWFVINHCPR